MSSGQQLQLSGYYKSQYPEVTLLAHPYFRDMIGNGRKNLHAPAKEVALSSKAVALTSGSHS